MAPDLYSEQIFQRVQVLEQEGNVNLLVTEMVKHYGQLRPVRQDLLERVTFYLESFGQFLSFEVVKALKSLPTEHLREYGLLEKLDTFSPSSPIPSCGRISFPIVTTRGQVRELTVSGKATAELPSLRLKLLDQIGASVFSVLQESLSWVLFWDPGRFSFQVLDTFGREDTTVSGESMGLPLALALYSLVTKKELPSNLSATAAVKRNGSVEAVEGLKEKLVALRRERHFVERVLISKRQEMNFTVRDLKQVRVDNLKDAINMVFPDPVDPAVLLSRIDVDTEVKRIESQYYSYLIDTCMENALKLTRYLEARGCPIARDRAMKALFVCYWRRGSCHCHKGQVELAKRNLDKAHALYKKHPGVIRPHKYLNMKTSHAILLKDIFRYKEAEDLHKAVSSEAKTIAGVDEEKAKNLSSLSQLYLAQRRFQEAVEFQRKAIRLFGEEERHRNYAYLGIIFTRGGDFTKAAGAFKRAFNFLERIDSNTRNKNLPFYHLYYSEYLYRSGVNQKRGAKKRFQELHEIAGQYPDISWYVPALIHKFAGLAYLQHGEESAGLEWLEHVICFFDSRFDVMHRLLGATVLAERALYLLNKGMGSEGRKDVVGIKKNLVLQKDIKRFFNEEIRIFSRFLRIKHPKRNHVNEMYHTLEGLREKIPY